MLRDEPSCESARLKATNINVLDSYLLRLSWRGFMNPTNDTHPAIEAFLIEGYRKMTAAQKLERVRALTRAATS
jgi:hypothetical protein